MTQMYDLLTNSVSRRYADYVDTGISCEVEAEFSRELDVTKPYTNWRIMGDGSLRGYGYEFVTKTPAKSLHDFEKYFDELAPVLNKNYKESNRTSTHIHINVLKWSEEQLYKFFLVYYLCENQLNRFAGVHRDGNLFCLALSDAESTLDGLKEIIDGEYNKVLQKFDQYKYAALNIANIPKIGTVEFRQFRGTKNVNEIIDWVSRLLKLIQYSHSFKSYESIMDSFLMNPVQFIKNATGIEVTDIHSVDSNYSPVYNIYRYIVTAPERIRVRMKKQKNVYRFSEHTHYMSEQDRDLM